MRHLLVTCISALFFSQAAAAANTVKPVVKEAHLVVYKKQGSFADTRDLIKDAIIGRGLVINNVSHIGDMLERTGKDLGTTRPVYLHAESLEFCSATVSRGTMEASPYNIVFCPYIISIYSLPSDPKTSYVLYRRPQIVGSEASRKSLVEVEKLLEGIIQDALAW